MLIEGVTHKPIIVKNDERKYVIIGSIDHGMEVPSSSVLELISSLENVEALMMETPEEFHRHMHPMSTELLVKASVGQAPIHYLSGNGFNEAIGEHVLKYSPMDIAEIFVPCIYIRNSSQLGQEPTLDSLVEFTSDYNQRFGFLDVERAIMKYTQLLSYWKKHELDPEYLDHFSYDFEKFIGDIREFELWQPELKDFIARYKKAGKVAACVGDYHVPFVQSIFEDIEVQAPNFETHIDTRREDRLTPQDGEFLRKIYVHINAALKA